MLLSVCWSCQLWFASLDDRMIRVFLLLSFTVFGIPLSASLSLCLTLRLLDLISCHNHALFLYVYIYMSVLEGREARCVCNTIRREEGFWSAGVVGYCSSFYHSVRWSLVWTSSIVWFVFSPFSHKWNTGWKSGEMRNLVHD